MNTVHRITNIHDLYSFTSIILFTEEEKNHNLKITQVRKIKFYFESFISWNILNIQNTDLGTHTLLDVYEVGSGV